MKSFKIIDNKSLMSHPVLQSFAELLVQLQPSTGVQAKILLSRGNEQLLEPPRQVITDKGASRYDVHIREGGHGKADLVREVA